MTTTLLVYPRPITGSACENCGKELAWRSGIGRVVITHATGDDKCHPAPTAKLSPADVDAANTELLVMDDLLKQQIVLEALAVTQTPPKNQT